MGVQNFDMIVALLAPELRIAFEAERAARQAELDSYLAASSCDEQEITAVVACCEPEPKIDSRPLPTGRMLLEQIEQWLDRHGRSQLRELFDGLRPRVVAQN
jgi:hypothetical protein